MNNRLRISAAVLAVALMLGGCGAVSDTTIQRDVELLAGKAVSVKMPTGTNIAKKFYKLYLVNGIGRLDATATTNTFEIDGVKALLNLDVAAIIESSYYKSDSDNGMSLRAMDALSDPLVTKTGRFTNTLGKEIIYQASVKQLAEGADYIMVQTTQFIFTAVAAPAQVAGTIYEMIKILRTCQVDTDAVVAAYANAAKTSYTKTTITLFDETLPSSGVIASYLEDWTSDPSFTIIDNTPDDSGNNSSGSDTINDEDNQTGTQDSTTQAGTTAGQ